MPGNRKDEESHGLLMIYEINFFSKFAIFTDWKKNNEKGYSVGYNYLCLTDIEVPTKIGFL